MASPKVFRIGIPVYELFDLLDLAAPCDMFFWMGQTWQEKSPEYSVKISIVAATTKPVMASAGAKLNPDLTFNRCPQFDLLWVPGGLPSALNKQMNDPTFLAFLNKQSQGVKFLTSVCEGALLLAAAGLLDGYRATTHWAFLTCLRRFSAIKVGKGYPRFVINKDKESGRYVVTGGGISSGLDEALKLVELITDEVIGAGRGKAVAKEVQLVTQYLPVPPFSVRIKGSHKCPLDDAK
jgi:cyclohexyl-isocyanide hydratase